MIQQASRNMKLYFLSFFCFIFVYTLSINSYAVAPNGILIDQSNFPDDGFRSLVSNYDANGDSILSEEEIASITEINTFFSNINSFQGIEFLWNLQNLSCMGRQLEQLDLYQFPNLRILDCSINNLTSLDVSACVSLEELNCRGNNLQELSVNNCPNLRILNCQDNKLTTLDVSDCSSLEDLNCSGNQLHSLNIQNCVALTRLVCSGNHLSALDLTSTHQLELLCCNFNQIEVLDMRSCNEIQTIDCIGNHMTQLNLGSHPFLKNMFCGFNDLITLNLSGCPSIEKLNCCYNSLLSLEWENNPLLQAAITFGNESYPVSPSVITISIPGGDVSYPYSLESDPTKKVTADANVQIFPSAIPPSADVFCPLVSTDPLSWGMPELANDYWRILTVRCQGSEQLNYLNTYQSDDYPTRYFLYDIDKNGTPELIVEGSGGEANRASYVFAGKDGRAFYVGSIHSGHSNFCTDPEENGVLLYRAHMGYMSIDRIRLIDGRLVSENIVPSTGEFKSSMDYPPVSDFVPGAAHMSYNCPVSNPILFRAWHEITEWLKDGMSTMLPDAIWPQGDADYYSNIISSDQQIILRGTIYRDNYAPILPFSSILSYERTPYSSATTEKYTFSIKDLTYTDYNLDGTIDCLALLEDLENNVRMPVVLSYDSGVAYVYIQEDLLSYFCGFSFSENSCLEYRFRNYLTPEPDSFPVKLVFYKDSFLYIRGEKSQ